MEITAIKLRNSHQIYYVHTNNIFVKRNTLCIAETEHGIDMGSIFKCPKHQGRMDMEVKGKILRMVTQNDLNALPDIEAVEKKAFKICREKIKEKKLDMKLVSVKCLFDKTKIIFYFVAENRIDFRELVRDLATVFRTRIEMRQIGVRDESRIIGGFGPCGKELCCVHLKEEFDPVSIKMAKEQSLNLNSLKISGMCGRLLCCLGYEYEVYREMNDLLPRIGTPIKISTKTYHVISTDPLKEMVSLKCEDHLIEVSREDITIHGNEYSINKELLQKVATVIEEEDDPEFQVHQTPQRGR